MKKKAMFTVLTVVGVLFGAAAAVATEPATGLGNLATLVGEWEGQTPEGTARSTFELVGGGSALLEKIQVGDHPLMVTVYYRDGDALMLNHYCALQNQPQMRSTSSIDADRIDFDLVDVANLASPGAPHMRSAQITFVDKDHVTANWTLDQGGELQSNPIEFVRVK